MRKRGERKRERKREVRRSSDADADDEVHWPFQEKKTNKERTSIALPARRGCCFFPLDEDGL